MASNQWKVIVTKGEKTIQAEVRVLVDGHRSSYVLVDTTAEGLKGQIKALQGQLFPTAASR